MSEEPDYRIDELESQMEAAEALINSLEEEVESLRRDLEQASVALRMAQQEVSARERTLEQHDLARLRAEQQAQSLRDSVTELRIQSSDEQLQLRNQHIAELARMQDRFGAQRISDMGKAFSGEDTEVLKEEYQRDLRELEQRRQRDIQALESSYEEWKDRLLEGEKELKGHYETEIRDLRQEVEVQRKELQQALRAEYDQRLVEVRQSAETRHAEEVRDLRESAEERERKLRQEHQAEVEALRNEAERDLGESDEKRRRELREIKALAENRERELRRGQSARIKEASEEAGRRLAALQNQRKADNEALQSRYEKELAQLRQEHEERLAAEVGRRQQEILSLEEKFESLKLERTSEARAYISRLKALEAAQPTPQNGRVEVETDPENEERAREVGQLRERVADLKEALASSLATSEQLATDVESPSHEPAGKVREGDTQNTGANELEDRPELLKVPAPGPEEDRVRELEIRLREAQEERRHYADELGSALDKLRRLSDPEHRLRAGIAVFNESHHTRNVASISKALGLPDVHAGVEGSPPGKPTFTFVWKDISWRRYVAEPIDGLEEPRVYLVASTDDPEEVPPPVQETNARVDARGRLVLGIQAR